MATVMRGVVNTSCHNAARRDIRPLALNGSCIAGMAASGDTAAVSQLRASRKEVFTSAWSVRLGTSHNGVLSEAAKMLFEAYFDQSLANSLINASSSTVRRLPTKLARRRTVARRRCRVPLLRKPASTTVRARVQMHQRALPTRSRPS
jgi:hypothetical protein